MKRRGYDELGEEEVAAQENEMNIIRSTTAEAVEQEEARLPIRGVIIDRVRSQVKLEQR